jgi:hypothetical protein
MADELPNLNDVNVATAFSNLGKLRESESFPRNIAADDRFRQLMLRARAMCADGRLGRFKAREMSNVTHAIAKMSGAGRLDTNDMDVKGLLAALEQRAVLVASGMNSHDVSHTVYAFASLGWEPGAEARVALEAGAYTRPLLSST